MRLYYFTPENHALENIEKRHLKVSFANEVNDLFELKPFDFKKRQIRRAWQKAINKHAQTQGFISFAKNWKVPTMWAHYANNHRGVCYGFDISPDKLCKIKYRKKLRQFDKKAFTDEVANNRMTDYAHKTKSIHWKYENEWRQYISLSDSEIRAKAVGETLFFLNFSNKFKLREVIIGAKSKITSPEIKDTLDQADDVKILTARPSFRGYKMVRQKLERLQK